MPQTKRKGAAPRARPAVDRVQTGLRLERKMLKVLKALAEYQDISLADLLEGIVLHAFDGRPAFGGDSLRRIAEIKRIYGLTLDSADSHRLLDREEQITQSAADRQARPARLGRGTARQVRPS